jgi:hypothetical protein
MASQAMRTDQQADQALHRDTVRRLGHQGVRLDPEHLGEPPV